MVSLLAHQYILPFLTNQQQKKATSLINTSWTHKEASFMPCLELSSLGTILVIYRQVHSKKLYQICYYESIMRLFFYRNFLSKYMSIYSCHTINSLLYSPKFDMLGSVWFDIIVEIRIRIKFYWNQNQNCSSHPLRRFGLHRIQK